MKVLCAIMGCELHARKGFHQVIRETWGQEFSKEGVGDLRFFVGRGRHCLADDEIRLDVPDDKDNLLYKVHDLLQWAVDQKYDLVFKVNTNTYVNVAEIKNLNYDGVDYAGAVVGRLGESYSGTEAYGFIQGSASWLSAKAAKIVIRDVVGFAEKAVPHFFKYNGWIAPYLHSEDLWIGQVLTPYLGDLRVVIDGGYSNGPLTYWSQSGYVKKYCLTEWMRAMHKARPDVKRMNETMDEYRKRG